METLKKKRSEVRGDGRLSGKKVRVKKERYDGGATADDAELEKFFAIVKRLRAGVDYFQKKSAVDYSDGSAAPPPATASGLWDPAFKLEDFNLADDGSPETCDGGALQKDTFVGFDLNADPETDQKSN